MSVQRPLRIALIHLANPLTAPVLNLPIGLPALDDSRVSEGFRRLLDSGGAGLQPSIARLAARNMRSWERSQEERVAQALRFAFQREADLAVVGPLAIPQRALQLLLDYSDRMSVIGALWPVSQQQHELSSDDDQHVVVAGLNDLRYLGRGLSNGELALRGGEYLLQFAIESADVFSPNFRFAFDLDDSIRLNGNLGADGDSGPSATLSFGQHRRTVLSLDHQTEAIVLIEMAARSNRRTRLHAVLYPNRTSRVPEFLRQLQRAVEDKLDLDQLGDLVLAGDPEIAALAQTNDALRAAWARVRNSLNRSKRVSADDLDHLLLQASIKSPLDDTYTGLQEASAHLRTLRDVAPSTIARLNEQDLSDLQDALDDVRTRLRQRVRTIQLSHADVVEESARTLSPHRAGKGVVFYVRLGSYETTRAAATLQRQLSLLRSFADLARDDVNLRYRLFTFEQRPGVLEAQFEVILEVTDTDPADVQALREGLGELVHSTFAGSYALTFGVDEAWLDLRGQERLVNPSHVLAIRQSINPGGLAVDFDGIPDWGHLIDYMRSLDRPTVVEMVCSSCGPRARESVTGDDRSKGEPFLSSHLERRDRLNGEDVIREILIREWQDGRRLCLSIVVGSDDGVPPGLAELVATEIGGAAGARITEAEQDDLVQAAVLSPARVLQVFHPPFGRVYKSAGFGPPQLTMPTDFHDFPIAGVRLGSALEAHPKGDQRIDVRLDERDRLRHLYVIGKTGTGKTNLLKQLAAQDVIAPRRGVTVLDPHGDLADYVLNAVPASRRRDVTLIDLSRRDLVPVLNPLSLAQKKPELRDRMTRDLVDLFRQRFYHEFTGPRFEEMVRLGIHTTLDEGYPLDPSLVEVPRLFTDDRFQRAVVARIVDDDLKQRWEFHQRMKSDRDFATTIDWLVSKFDEVLTDRSLRCIVGGGASTVDFAEIVENGGILIAKLSSGVVGAEAANLVGALVLLLVRLALYEREIETVHRSPHFVYLDEFQNFTTASVDSLVAEARKFGVGFVLAHQNLEQLRDFSSFTGRPIDQLVNAIMGNVGHLVVFGVGAIDAAMLARQLQVDEEDVLRVGRYDAVARLMVEGRECKSFVLSVDEAIPRLSPRALDVVDEEMESRSVLRSRAAVLEETEERVATWLGSLDGRDRGEVATFARKAVARSGGENPRTARGRPKRTEPWRDELERLVETDVQDPGEAVVQPLVPALADRVGGRFGTQSSHGAARPELWGDIAGPFYTAEGVAAVLSVSSPDVVRGMAESGVLLQLETRDAGHVYPAFQVDETTKTVVNGMDRILQILRRADVDPWLAAGWFGTELAELGGVSPAAWLREDKDLALLESVCETASGRYLGHG